MRSLPFAFFLPALVCAGGCVTHAEEPPVQTTPIAPSLPRELSDGQNLLDYYPPASRRLHEQGRVVLKLQVNPSGAVEQPIQIDHERTDASPRLEEAAQKMIFHRKFGFTDNYKSNVTLSVVFELVPCGSVEQDPTVDYRINLCLDPSP